jgi:hypothetical protein
MTDGNPGLALPPSLSTWLDEGMDLTTIPDLENYARAIVIGRHTLPEEVRDQLAGHFWRSLQAWSRGESVETHDGQVLEPTVGRLRHALWMCEALVNAETAERFEAALPAEIRAACWARIMEVRGQRQ